MSRVIMLLDSHVRFSTEKITIDTKKKKTWKCDPFMEEKIIGIEKIKKNQTGILNWKNLLEGFKSRFFSSRRMNKQTRCVIWNYLGGRTINFF